MNQEQEYHIDKIIYLEDGIIYKTGSDNSKMIVIKDYSEVKELYEKVAELHSLKISINESPLANYFPAKDMSFHDKVLFAIHKINELNTK